MPEPAGGEDYTGGNAWLTQQLSVTLDAMAHRVAQAFPPVFSPSRLRLRWVACFSPATSVASHYCRRPSMVLGSYYRLSTLADLGGEAKRLGLA